MFSGHQYGNILHSSSSHLVEQIPPTVLWGRVYYVMPLKDVQSYAIKIVTSSKCVIKIYCNSSLIPIFTTALNGGEFRVKIFSNDEYCKIESTSEILVAQFSIGPHNSADNGDIFMALVPSKKQYYHKFEFADVNDNIYENFFDSYYDHYSYVNIIVLAQYFQPDKIYLIADGDKRSLETQQWVPIKAKNITEAYATQITNITYDTAEIYHANETFLMTVMTYGFSRYGGLGTAISNRINKGIYVFTYISSYVRTYM